MTGAEAVNEVADVVLVAAPFELADVRDERVVRLCVGTELIACRLAEINPTSPQWDGHAQSCQLKMPGVR